MKEQFTLFQTAIIVTDHCNNIRKYGNNDKRRRSERVLSVLGDTK